MAEVPTWHSTKYPWGPQIPQHRPVVPRPGPVSSLASQPKRSWARSISARHELLGVKLTNPGQGIPPPRGLLLGSWKPEGCCLPWCMMLDLEIIVSFLRSSESPPTSPHLPLRGMVDAKPGHFYCNPPVDLVLHCTLTGISIRADQQMACLEH